MKRVLTLGVLLATLFVACTPAEPVVRIETTMGNVKIKLYNETPIHRDNFLKLVDSNFYEGVLFHRVIDNFMDQF